VCQEHPALFLDAAGDLDVQILGGRVFAAAKLWSSLVVSRSEQVEAMETAGRPFDPACHEAVAAGETAGRKARSWRRCRRAIWTAARCSARRG
jgi:hypothetical protein